MDESVQFSSTSTARDTCILFYGSSLTQAVRLSMPAAARSVLLIMFDTWTFSTTSDSSDLRSRGCRFDFGTFSEHKMPVTSSVVWHWPKMVTVKYCGWTVLQTPMSFGATGQAINRRWPCFFGCWPKYLEQWNARPEDVTSILSILPSLGAEWPQFVSI